MKAVRRLATLLLVTVALLSPSAPAGAAPVQNSVAMKASAGLDLSAVKGNDRRDQIERVVESMDRTGAPPAGVVQGGRRGVFRNAEGRLPRMAAGYWKESDVWPRRGNRGVERLIFGRDGEVYYTRDHYESFVRLR